jgi:hypothetical protein
MFNSRLYCIYKCNNNVFNNYHNYQFLYLDKKIKEKKNTLCKTFRALLGLPTSTIQIEESQG